MYTRMEYTRSRPGYSPTHFAAEMLHSRTLYYTSRRQRTRKKITTIITIIIWRWCRRAGETFHIAFALITFHYEALLCEKWGFLLVKFLVGVSQSPISNSFIHQKLFALFIEQYLRFKICSCLTFFFIFLFIISNK